MTKTSKKYLAALAGLLILLYHCWVPIFKFGSVLGNAERFILTTSFLGVDIFFFISAYSLATRPVELKDYFSFILNRAARILPLFFIALLFKKFLWFIPAIMIMYLVFPLAYRACIKRPGLSFILLIAIWAGITYLVLGVIKPSKDFGIFLFRIPIIILGGYAAKIDKEGMVSNKLKFLIGIVLLILGTFALYQWGYLNRLNVPFKGTFYLVGIPSTIALVFIVTALAANAHSTIIEMVGEMTLELYFTQMVLGTFLTNTFYRLFQSRLITNIFTLLIVTTISLIIHEGYMKAMSRIK